MDINVIGAKELEKKLLALEPKIGKKVVRQALRAGAKIVQNKQKSNVNSMVGGSTGSEIAKNIKVRAERNRRPQTYAIRTIIETNDTDLIYHTAEGERYFIPFAIEYGHAFPGRGGDENSPKDVPANPALRTAYDSSKGEAQKKIVSMIRRGVEREASK